MPILALLLKERQNENLDSRSLKRNKTFTGATNGRTPPAPGATTGGGQRRHRRGTKGRYTVPLWSAPTSPMVAGKNNQDPLGPLYIQTSRDIYVEAFGNGKRNSLDRNQINQLTAALALPDRCGHNKKEQISPKSITSTSSSGFGSTDALGSTTPRTPSSPDEGVSPRSDIQKIDRSSVQKINIHFWVVLCIQTIIFYFRQISDRARRRLETTPPVTGVDRVSEIEPIKKIDFRQEPKLKNQRVKRKLQFDDDESFENDEPLKKPFYTELHLGRENQRATTLAAIEADRSEYPIRKLIDRASETKYVTTVFEVRQRGLEEIADSVGDEIRRWYCEQNDSVVVVCCELQWSTPDRYRNVTCETRMKDDVLKCLRRNNRRVFDVVGRRNRKMKNFDRYLIFPDSVTEEMAGRRPGMLKCWGGSYRRYYSGLLPWGHDETAHEHRPWWEFKKHSLPESIEWPLIAGADKTTFIILNMICLKLDQL